MQKFGTMTLKESDTHYDVIWTTSNTGSGINRIDVIDDINRYSIIDTTPCAASYIASRGRMEYLGDKNLISRLLDTVNTASTFKANVKQETSIEDGKIRIIQSKEAEKLGLRWYSVMDFGNITEELYETKDTLLLFDSIDKTGGVDTKPINFGLYEDFNSVLGNTAIDKSTGDYYSLDYLIQKYHLEHMKNYDFVVVDSMVSAIARLEQFEKADTKVKAIDLETTGLKWCMLGEDVLVGVVLSWNENESTYYPFRQENFKYNLPMSFLQKIIDVINNQPKDVKIIGHNVKVEMQGIWKECKYYVGNSDYAKKWDPNWQTNALKFNTLRVDGDSMLLSILIDPAFYKGAHSLKSLATRYRKVNFLELERVFKDKKSIKFNVLPPDIVKYYACPDTANTIYIWNRMIKELPDDEFGILDLETRMIPITAEMEFYGMRTQKEYLLESIENEQYIVDMLADMFKKIHKTSANINSPDVRRDIFYNKLRAPIKVRTKTGAPSTSSKALKAIIDSGHFKLKEGAQISADIVDRHGKVVVEGKDLSSNKYPSLIILDAYAKHFKELGALKRIERKSKKDRVYFGLNQAGAATGRATSDAHQYSDAMKKAIIADGDDFWLWSSDFKQVELRILPFVAKQQDLIELESSPDVDVHRAILSLLTKKPIWAISASERKNGKSTNFGVVYMMSSRGLAEKRAGVDFTNEDEIEAQASITSFYNGFPNIKELTERNKYNAQTYGVIRNKFGRRRFFKELLDPEVDNKTRSSLLRAANNFPIQSFGADLLKICQCNLQDYIHTKGWDELIDVNGIMMPKVRLMLPIHDEVLVSSHKSIPIDEIITMFKVCMEVKIAGAPPFFSAPAKVGCWYDGKLDKYEIDLHYRDEVVEACERGKHIIHSYSYIEDLSWDDAKIIINKCDELRPKIIDIFKEDLINAGMREDASILTETNVDNLTTSRKLSSSEQKRKSELVTLLTSGNINGGSARKAALDLIGPDVFTLVRHYTQTNDTTLMLVRLLDKDFDWYLEDLSNYRTNRLKTYMDGLIVKYKTVDEVAKHVDHPELTHTLISVMIGKDEKFEHIEAIHEAVSRYMSNNTVIDVNNNAKEEDIDDVKSIEDFEGLNEYIEFDENGEMLDPEIDEFNGNEEDDLDLNSSIKTIKRTYCSFMLREVIVDLSEFNDLPATAENINQAIARLNNPKEYYNVVYLLHGKLLKSKIKVGYIPDEIDNIINYWKEQIGGNKVGTETEGTGIQKAN